MKEHLNGRSFAIETYGCQMNRADSGIMETLLDRCGMRKSKEERYADVIIMNTCSVREHAESRVCTGYMFHKSDLESVRAIPSFRQEVQKAHCRIEE